MTYSQNYFFLSIIIPFISFDYNLKKIIASLFSSQDLEKLNKKIQVVLVCNGEKINLKKASLYVSRFYSPIFFFTFRNYTFLKGPAPSWCYGAKVARGRYVLFLASDTHVEKFYIQNFIKGVTPKLNFYLGDYSGNLLRGDIPYLESLIDYYRFFNKNDIDFRNFGFKKKAFLKILKKYFQNKFCTDVELNFVIKYFNYQLICLPNSLIFNGYPKNIFLSLKRKLKHGIGCGRIFRRFHLNYAKKIFKDKEYLLLKVYTAPFINWFHFIIIPKNCLKKLNMSKKFKLFFLNLFFSLGIILGYCLPAGFIKNYYTFHFDEK